MRLKNLIENYLKEGRMMMMATVSGDQPWNATLYYVSDDKLNIYWISKSDTRHSQEIHKHKKIAAAIPIRYDDLVVVGLQVEGDAELVEDIDEIKKAIRLFTDKHQRGEDWYSDFIAGKNEHRLYRIKPRLFVLFDRENFPDNSRQEYSL